MRTCALKTPAFFLLTVILSIALVGGACQQQQQTPVANTNANTANANVATPANTNTALAVDPGTVINTREPETYRATLVLTAQTEGGERAIAIPQVSAEVARDRENKRLSFKLPNNEQIVYLDRADKHYIISPTRRQYAELTREATGFQINDLMTPGQLVSFLEKQRGYERVGEEMFNGRMTDKYRYAATAKTGTQAGEVKSETFAYVDKETGLPLRFELFSEATGNVQGVKGVKAVAEMRDIQTNVEPTLFDVPQDYKKVEPEQVRQQINALTQAVSAVVGALLKNMSTQGGGTTTVTTTTTTTASPSPTATVSPAVR